MKKIFKISFLVAVLIAAFSLTACSQSTSSSSSSDYSKFEGNFKGSVSNGTKTEKVEVVIKHTNCSVSTEHYFSIFYFGTSGATIYNSEDKDDFVAELSEDGNTLTVTRYRQSGKYYSGTLKRTK